MEFFEGGFGDDLPVLELAAIQIHDEPVRHIDDVGVDGSRRAHDINIAEGYLLAYPGFRVGIS